MAHFEHTSMVAGPRKDTYAFLTHLENLGSCLPPDYKVLHIPKLFNLQKGLEFPIRLSRYGISVEWKITVEDFEPGEFYRYRQSQGPFSYWVHSDKLEDHVQGTIINTVVDFEMPFGLFGKLAEDLYMQRELQRVFDFRQTALERHFKKPVGS